MKYQNNPFNIRRSHSHWLGSVSTPSDKFEKFDTLDHGIRAFFIIMSTYRKKYHCYTIRSIVSRFAPSSENDTFSYINFVSHYMEISPDSPLVSAYDYINLAVAMAYYESHTFLLFGRFERVWNYFHLDSKFRF